MRPPQGGVSADYLSKLLYNAYHHPVQNPVQIAGMPKRKKKQKKRSVPLGDTEKKAMTVAKTVYLQAMAGLLTKVHGDVNYTRIMYLLEKKKITLVLLETQRDIVNEHVQKMAAGPLKAKYENEIEKKQKYYQQMIEKNSVP